MPRSRTLLVLLALATLVAGARLSGLGFDDVVAFVERLRGLGPLGFAIFVALYALATWGMVPASWLQGAAGFLYGPFVGFAVAWLSSTAFGAGSFWLARGRFRPRVERWLGEHEQLGDLDAAVGERGAPLVALVRLPPISPYNVINYLFGLTSVSPRAYLLGSAVGGLIPCFVWSFVGAQVADLGSLTTGSGLPAWVQTSGIVITAVVTVMLAWIARRAVEQAAAVARARS